MMNFTALSLTLLWNSPIYCICSNSSSSSCRSKCDELGYYYLPNDKSLFKSLRDNIHHEITFILIPNFEFNQSFYISLPYFIFKDRSITLSSYSKSRINVNLEIDTSSIKFDKSHFKKKIIIQKGSLKLNYIDLIFSLSSIKLSNYSLNSIEFDSLSIINSSLIVKHNEKTINLRSRNLFIDDESLKLIALSDLNNNSSLDDEENNTGKIMIYSTLPFSFDELNIYITYTSNIISINNSWLSFSESDIIYEKEDFNKFIQFIFNVSCSKIRFIQENCFNSNYLTNFFPKKEYNISVFIYDTPTPISCDFSYIEHANINAFIKYENKTNIINSFDIDAGSNSINIITYTPNDEDIPSISSDYQFSTSEEFTYSSMLNSDNFSSETNSFEEKTYSQDTLQSESLYSQNPTSSTDQLPESFNHKKSEAFSSENFYSENDQSSFESNFTPEPIESSIESENPIQPKPHSYIYEPFFFISGNCDIFIDSISLPEFINSSQSLKEFIIDSNSINNLSDLFKSITESPYQTISLTIDLMDEHSIIIPPSVFYRKSFHIKSIKEDQHVFFNNSNFSIGTFQNFTNIIVSSSLQEKLNFSSLRLHNSFIHCHFTCTDLIVDYDSLILQNEINNSSDFSQIYKNIFIEIPTNMNFDVYPTNRAISIDNNTFDFFSDSVENVFLITDSNSSVYFESIDNETEFEINERINFTFIVNKNDIFEESIIIFQNAENISEELSYFSIDARSTIVNVISEGFDFTIKDSIRLTGDMSVNFNNLNSLFFNSYCICNDKDEDFDCLEVCDPDMGPILPFDKDIISNTVQLIPMNYLNFTIFGSNNEKNPYFVYSLFNKTSLDIKSGQINKTLDEDEREQAYLTLETSHESIAPAKDIICKLSDLCFIIAPQETPSLFLNFATAFFSSLNFIIPSNSTLTISSVAVETDVLTLLRFPSNLIFASPIQMCNISCSTIISTIVIRSNQQIDLRSEEYNISYRLDLSLLLHMPANISCMYGTSKANPLKILLLEDQPNSLADIPDLRFDVSRITASSSYIEFPDQWNSNIEDISSKIEIFHNDKTLYIQGKVVDDVYTTKPPTIFHNGAGYLYINGILSTFKIKYCICDTNMTDCATTCKSIGPVISFDQEDITATIKSNPTRHITYVIFGSLPDWRPYFRLSDFAVKSFTLSSETSHQFIDLETAPSTPVVPLNHRFISLSIRPIPFNDTADMKFHSLYLEKSKIDCRFMTTNIEDSNENKNNGDGDDDEENRYLNEANFSFYDSNCTLSQIGLTTDLESAYALSKANILSPAKSLTILGRRSLSKVVMESKNEIELSSRDNETMMVKFNLSELSPKESAVSISSLLGAQNNTKQILSVELPQHETSYNQIPNLRFDLTQVDGSRCFMLFPTSMWTGELSNLSQKIVVEYGRHDFYQESSKHENRYDGIPPIVSAIGSGGYYINGILYGEELKLPTSKPIQKPFKSLGPSAIAGIVVGSVAFVVIVVGTVIILIQKKKKNNNESFNEQTTEVYRQVNLGLVDEFSDENDV